MGFPRMGGKGPNYTQWSLCCIVCLCALAQPCCGQLYAFCGSEGSYRACTTSPEKLTRNANYSISVEPQTATCGSLPNNKYFIKLGQTTAETCQATSHLPKYMVDLVHSETWWQSATWPIAEYNKNQEYPINITLSFHKMYRLSQNISLTFKSGRPQRMILEKSADYGKTWTPLQYYSRSCSTFFPGVPMKYTREKPATVICTEEFSRDGAIPQPGRKVNFPGSYPRLSSSTREEYYIALDTLDLRDLLCFTDLRVRLVYPNTDSKEKTAQNIFDFLHYYYAISDIDVTASCFCNQHASTCIPNSNQDMECVCSHNTEGKDCERCKPLYNDAPWKAGSFVPFDQGTPNPCKKCECNEHAVSCTYNTTYKRGMCNNCQHNTAGHHCEKCQDGFFPNVTLPKNDTSICLACNCESRGVMDPTNMKCEQVGSVLRQIGQCFCKPLVTGRRCDICVNEYYGLLLAEKPGTCKACQCNTFGTANGSKVCAQTDGQCPCKKSTAGRKCDICKAGYYQFPHQNPSLECKSCNCDPGGSKTAVCDTTYGVCTCREHTSNAKCDVVDSKFFVPALDDYVMQPEKGNCKIHGDLWTGANPFDGKMFAECPPTTLSLVEFQQSEGKVTQPSLSWAYHVGVRYTLNDAVQRPGARLEIAVLGSSGVSVKGVLDDQTKAGSTSCLTSPGQIANIPMTFTKGVGIVWLSDQSSTILDRRCRYEFKLRLQGEKNATLPIRIDSVVLVPGLEQHVTKQSLRVLTEAANKGQLKSTYLQCAKQLTSLISRDASMKNEPCRGLLWSVAAEIHNGAKPCECDQTGSLPGTSCDTHGGQCRCKPGVGGRRCDSCRPGYYNMTGSGCQPCDCDTKGSEHGACDVKSGQCKCRQNVANLGQVDVKGSTGDKQCKACLANFYGFGGQNGCLPCQCSTAGSSGTQCSQDGQCPCKPTIGSRMCDKCQPSYYLFSQLGCSPCNCSSAGASSQNCHEQTGVCTCKENVQGPKCDQCKTGFFNLAKYNPKGCQPCFCYEHGSTCISADGFREKLISSAVTTTWTVSGEYILAPSVFLGDKHSSFGQLLKFKVALNNAIANLSSEPFVILEGDGVQLIYAPSSLVLNSGSNEIEVRLFPENWKLKPAGSSTSARMYRVLGSLSKLMLRKIVGQIVFGITDVSLVSGEPASGATTQNGTGIVEKCTCPAADLVGGLSCEMCAEGNRRVNGSAATSYSKCVACDCSKRGATSPPKCDQMTGRCLNCRNGTMGDRCEKCSPHVQGTECNQCEDKYWGISPEGCKACNCSKPGSKSEMCNKVTGQCTCASNVVGRTCDVCQDNYHTLTANGCTVCDDCYSLVMTEVTKLRQLRDNLTSTVKGLAANDDTSTRGLYVTRQQAAVNTMNTLLNFLKETEKNEETVRVRLLGLNATLQYLSGVVDGLNGNNVPKIQGFLQEAAANLEKAENAEKETTKNIKDIHSSTEPLKKILTSLQGLVASLQSVEKYLKSLSDGASSDVKSIQASVALIENVTATANKLAQESLQAVQSVLGLHQTNTQRITELVNLNTVLSSRAATTLAEAKRVAKKSNDTSTKATDLEVGLKEIGAFSPNLPNINAILANTKSRAEATKAKSNTSMAAMQQKLEVLKTAVSKSEQLRVNTVNMASKAKTLSQRAEAAAQEAANAKQNSDKIFTAAQLMFETMKNFQIKAADVESNASKSLKAVQNVNLLSQQVIAEAGNLTQSMAVAQQESANAKDAAAQAKTVAQNQNAAISPVGQKAATLIASSRQELGDINTKAKQPETANITIVLPAEQKCAGYEATIVDATQKATKAAETVQKAAAEVAKVKTEASRILNELNNIASLDTARIEQLKTKVAGASGLFNQAQLKATITSLKLALDEQKKWLEAKKLRKAALDSQIKELKAVQELIIPKSN